MMYCFVGLVVDEMNTYWAIIGLPKNVGSYLGGHQDGQGIVQFFIAPWILFSLTLRHFKMGAFEYDIIPSAFCWFSEKKVENCEPIKQVQS